MQTRRYRDITVMLRVMALLILSISGYDDAIAQSNMTDDGYRHWESGIIAGLDNDGYSWQLHAAYFPVQYVGVKIGLGMAGEIKPLEYWDDEDYAYTTYDDNYTARFKFNPALVLRTPRLVNWKSQDAGFYIFAEPGMILSPGASGSRNTRYCCWDMKAGINMQLDRFILTIGYGISDFALYSGYPDNMHGLPDNDNYITHTVFVGTAFKF